MKVAVTNTPGILHLIINARGRNRSIDEDKFISDVDTQGTHVMAMSFPHNNVEIRTQWVCKMRNSDKPVEIWLDVDADALRECTTLIDVPEISEEIK